ncbi:MAG: hypothetical protein KGJ78_17330 [Alphaproteobacteria bacterium]|nr:hypothetical protein [Alphaproteobacteria bacterium]
MKTFAIAVVAAAIAAAPAFADAHSEIVNAETHAGLAGTATTIEMVHAHMHHALNCLVGPNGSGFDKKAMNPCAHAGNGAIPDTSDAAKKKSLGDVAAELQTGIAETDLAKAQNDATTAASMLKKDE